MNEPSFTQRFEIEHQIIVRAQQDPLFRELLRSNPQAALSSLFGFPLPPGVNITVLEETTTQRYLVLPPMPAPELATLEASDLDLALAGGGRTFRPSNPSQAHSSGAGRSNRNDPSFASTGGASRSTPNNRVLRRRAC